MYSRYNIDNNNTTYLVVGCPGSDGHKRITHSDENFIIVGGTEESHEFVTQIVINVIGELNKSGKTLDDIDMDDLVDYINDSIE